LEKSDPRGREEFDDRVWTDSTVPLNLTAISDIEGRREEGERTERGGSTNLSKM
jgi:hypothetical protein